MYKLFKKYKKDSIAAICLPPSLLTTNANLSFDINPEQQVCYVSEDNEIKKTSTGHTIFNSEEFSIVTSLNCRGTKKEAYLDVLAQERKLFYDLLYEASILYNSPIYTSGVISKDVIEASQYEVERGRTVVDKFVFTDSEALTPFLRRCVGEGADPRDYTMSSIDYITNHKKSQPKCLVGNIWGVLIYEGYVGFERVFEKEIPGCFAIVAGWGLGERTIRSIKYVMDGNSKHIFKLSGSMSILSPKGVSSIIINKSIG